MIIICIKHNNSHEVLIAFGECSMKLRLFVLFFKKEKFIVMTLKIHLADLQL